MNPVDQIARGPEKRPSPMAVAVIRVRLFERACEMIGKNRLAARLGLDPRTVRKYAGVERGLTDATLRATADALEAEAATLQAHAAKLRSAAGAVAEGDA